MTFAEVIEYESAHPGTKFHRVDPRGGMGGDDEWHWYIFFDPDKAGKLSQGVKGKPFKDNSIIELYHHDLHPDADADWQIYEGN